MISIRIIFNLTYQRMKPDKKKEYSLNYTPKNVLRLKYL